MDLKAEVFGINFRNPVLNAAGPTGRDADALIAVAKGGAGGLVSKTISITPAIVPKPNMYSVGGGGLLNVESWSEIPASEWISTEYARAKKETGLPLIASIGYLARDVGMLAAKIEATGVVDAIECSVHYVPEAQGEKAVVEIVRAVRKNSRLPVIIKLSPHGYDVAAYARAAEKAGASAIAAINSLGPCMKVNIESGAAVLGGKAWLSGSPIKALAVRRVAEISASVKKIPVIGVGGIMNGADAVEHIMAGASLVQVCTAGILKGPKIHGIIAAQIGEFMKKHGYTSIEDFRGIALDYEGDVSAKKNAGPVTAVMVDSSLCSACNLCTESCVYGALKKSGKKGEKPELDAKKCSGCGLCVSVCPQNAIKLSS